MADNCHNVFVYGTLKSGFHNNYLLREGGAEFVGLCETVESFCFFDGLFPYLAVPAEVSKGRMQEFQAVDGMKAPVSGELWRCNARTLVQLDHLEGVPYHYRREVVGVVLSTGIKAKAGAYIWQNPKVGQRPLIRPNKAGVLVWPASCENWFDRVVREDKARYSV